MNHSQIRRNVGHHLKLHPVVVHLDQAGNELSDIDGDWALRSVSDSSLQLDNISSGHTVTLGFDHVHHYTSDPNRRGGAPGYGFLTLTVQLFIQGNHVHIRPTGRPGERRTLTGLSPEAIAARSALLDQRLQMVIADYRGRGTPRTMIDSFPDLTQEERAYLYERAIVLKKGRPPTNNPYL